jgi:hypothetical protein
MSHMASRTILVAGGVYVQFECIEDAQHFRSSFNGDYWKNNTLHVDFCDNAEIEVNLGPSTVTAKDSVKLFVANTRGITAAQIYNAVAPIVLNDVKVCGGFTAARARLAAATLRDEDSKSYGRGKHGTKT